MLGAVPATIAAVAPAADRPCRGAAARDLVHRCVNPTRKVYPSPNNVGAATPTYCAPVRRQLKPKVCTFGVRSRQATAHFALVGDSHALQWRSALDHVAHRLRWHGSQITTPGCIYSEAVYALPHGLLEPCEAWYEQTARWLRRHPNISTLFVAQSAPTKLVVGPGQTYRSIKIDGFRRAWRALPKTISHIVVIHDTPRSSRATFDCVKREITKGSRPGPACRFPRRAAFSADMASAAVRSLHAKRYREIDMSRYFCGSKSCYPVIGGLLVHRDAGHISPAYAKSLGPYLLREVRRLRRRW